jgi:hypothetical protein
VGGEGGRDSVCVTSSEAGKNKVELLSEESPGGKVTRRCW